MRDLVAALIWVLLASCVLLGWIGMRSAIPSMLYAAAACATLAAIPLAWSIGLFL